MAASSSALATGVIIDIIVCISAFLVFSWLRVQAFSQKYFAPKTFTADLSNKPANLPGSLFGWIIPVWTYKEPEIIQQAGLDTAMYLRVMSFGFELFAWVSLWCLAAILPTNLTADNVDTLMNGASSNRYKFTTFDKCSLSNVPESSPRMWVHLLTVHVVTFIALRLLYRYSRESVLLRLMFLANSVPGRSTHTVLVTDIPGVAKATGSRAAKVVEQRMAFQVAGRVASRQVWCNPAVLEAIRRQAEESDEEEESAVDEPVPGVSQLHPAGAPGVAAGHTSPRPSPQLTATFLPPSQPGSREQSPRLPGYISGSPAGRRHGASTIQAAGSAQELMPLTSALPGSQGATRAATAPGGFGVRGSDDMDCILPQHRPASDLRPQRATTTATTRRALLAQRTFSSRVSGSREDEVTNGALQENDTAVGSASRQESTTQQAEAEPVDAPGLAVHRYSYDLQDRSLDSTVMADNILSKGISAKKMVTREFRKIYPDGAVAKIEMVKDQSELEPLVKEYDKLKLALEDYLDECKHCLAKGKRLKRKKVMILVPALGPWGKRRYGNDLIKRVDALDHWVYRLRELDSMIGEEQYLSSQVVWPSAFVTFSSRRNQCTAATSLHHHDTTTWLTQPAPEPDELVWANLGMTLPMRSSASTLMWFLYACMVLFFMIPVSMVQGLIEVSKLEKAPGLEPLVRHEAVQRLLEAVVPGLALKVFILLVPFILRAMLKAAGAISESQLDLGVVSRFFIFQIIVVFLGSVVVGSFFNQIEQWIHEPSSVVQLLGTAIPMVCTFFITYIAILGLVVKPLAGIRALGLAIFWVLYKLSSSPKARDRIWQEQYTSCGTTTSDHMIAILLGMVYSCINPIICPMVLAYFAVNTLIERYQNIYVYRRKYESAGQLWPKIFTQMLVVVYIMQSTMMALLSIKKFAYAPLLIPCMLATLAFHISCMRLFSRPWRLMALHDAVELDSTDKAAALLKRNGPIGAGGKAQESAYLSPGFKIIPGEIEDLLTQATAMGCSIDEAQATAASELLHASTSRRRWWRR